jgi:hypothetical protein
MALSISRTARRRIWGGVFLGLAILMLFLGETALAGRLSPGGFLGYWGLCFLCTCAAIAIAFFDVRETQQNIRSAQRELLGDALKEIQLDARAKKQKVRKNGR